MRTTCLKCNNALTIRDVIQNTCSNVLLLFGLVTGWASCSPVLQRSRQDFDALISEELKKRAFEPAA